MGKSKLKTNNVSGFRIAVMIFSVLLLSAIMAFSMLLGISSLKQHGPVVVDPNATTVRKKPVAGALPTEVAPIDNIGYMAYVLDSQPFYNIYAYNSTKSTGYEQITQSWKDYKTADASGEEFDVMVASDLSYSGLIKSATQTCFIGDNEAHVRGGNKPGKNSVPLDIEWANGKPSVYDREKYKYDYGEFAKEISVYVINEKTVDGADAVVDNGDGTYSQKFYLNEGAGCWYQYGMKTRGGLKKFPVFKKIEITFTFDAEWRIIESYCEERATINPRALGGMDMSSTSKTTTQFDYTEEGFDEAHFAYFKDYYKSYVGSKPDDGTDEEPVYGVIEILGGGFGKVLSQSGQQFSLDLTVGSTAYDGKVYLKLADMNDVLNSLDARIALEKRGSGRQDLFIEFKSGAVNVYYGTGFAMTANINEVSQSVTAIIDWIKGIMSVPAALADGADGGLDISSLLNDLKLDVGDTEAVISLNSDNLLNLGVGIDAVMRFDRTKEEDGDAFSVKSLALNGVKYGGVALDLSAGIVPDDGEVIARDPAQTPANLADYADSVYNILSSNTVKIDLGLDGTLIEGLTLDASAYLSIGSAIAADVELSALYKGISLKLGARYIYERAAYGKLYLHATEINGTAVDAKVYCDVGDTVDAVKQIISLFRLAASAEAEAAGNELADIINKVLNLDFAAIIGKVSGNADALSLEINVDRLLEGLGVSLGMDFGTLALDFNRADEIISGSVSGLGLSLAVSGSERTLPSLEDTKDYVDLTVYIESVGSLLAKPSYDISFALEGKKISDGLDLSGLKVEGVATAAVEGGSVRVKLPLNVNCDDYGVQLCAYYTVNLSDGGYGKIYLHVTSLTVNGESIALDARVYCDISRVADGIKDIIAKFTPSTQNAAEQSDLIAKVIETVLKLDYNEAIHATNEKLNVNLDVDEILAGLDISLGGISFGTLKLEFVTATASLSGTLENLGLTVHLNGNEAALEEFSAAGYVDLGIYVDSISALLSKQSYYFELSFAGNDRLTTDFDLTGLTLDASAQLALTDGFGGLSVNIDSLAIAYRGISLRLSAHYEVAFNGGYGKIYLRITEANGTEVSAKVALDITDAAESVKNIINAFKAPSGDASSESTDVLGKIISGVLKLDFSQFLNVTDDKATVKLDLDTLLSEFNLGLSLGTIEAEYVPAEYELTASDAHIGLNLVKFRGSDDALGAFSTEGFIDINAFIDAVENIINSGVYEIAIDFIGGEITDAIDLSGLTVSATAYAKLENGYNNVTVCMPVLVSYYGLEVELTVYYSADISAQDYSTVYVNVTRIDKTTINAKVYCDVREVIPAVKRIICAAAPAAQSGTADVISKVVGVLANIDFAEAVKGSAEKLSLTLNVDEILTALGLNLGVEMGSLQLDLTHEGLYGRLDKLGAEMSLKGNDGYVMPAAPVKGEYLDLTALLDIINQAIEQGKAIAEAEDVAFIIDASAVIDGTPAKITGNGEVIWKQNAVKAAASLFVAVDAYNLEVNFVYDQTSDPFVIFTLNEAGVKVNRSEIDKLVNAFEGLLGENAASGYALNVGGYTLEEILTNDNVRTVFNALLRFAGEFIVELDKTDAEQAIYNLVVKHCGGVTVTLGADGCLSLGIAKAGVFNATASVEAGSGETISSICGALSSDKYTYYGISEFLRILYSDLFDELEKISLKELLGDNPYCVKLAILGANSGIGALEGVSVNAELYYDEGLVGTRRATKLMHVALDMNINGTAVIANVAYSGRTLYVELNKVGATTLTGIRFKTDVMNVYDAAEQLVRMITDTNLVEMFNKISGKGSSLADTENIALFASVTDENGVSGTSTLTKLLGALLTLDLEESFVFDKQNGTAEINVDAITEALFGVKIGKISACFDDAAKTLNASLTRDGFDAWLTLDAAPCAGRADAINPDDYIDIGFISTLLTDLAKTVTDDNKQLYSLYTFTGSIAVDVKDIPVLGSINLRFNNATLTAGFDENDSFYLTLAASMQKTSVIGMALTENKDISITYSNGLIVLGRDIGTADEAYKVLTIEFFMDNMLDKNNSPLKWLLGTNATVWGILVDQIGLNIDSGLTKPKTYALYEQLQQTEKEDKFNLADYIDGLIVRTGNGEPVSVYGNGAQLATEKFNLSGDDNHYALDLNAKKLTGGTVTALCAVILRNENGLSGLKAYGEIGSMVNFTLDFGTYLEGVTELYGGKVYSLEQVSVDEASFYNDFAEASVTEADFDEGEYFTYDGEYTQATAYEEGVTYFTRVNTAYYLQIDGKAVLADAYDADATYYVYAQTASTKKLGEAAMPNYLAHAIEKYGFDINHAFTNDKPHTESIFGCFSTNGGVYESSDVLEKIYLDVYASTDATVPERTLEVLYGSTVKLIRDFPEFADDGKTLKLTYLGADGEILPDTIVIDDAMITYVDGKGRVAVYKSSEAAVEVVFDFLGLGGMNAFSAALAFGDALPEYGLNGYSFLGWYKDKELTLPALKVNRGDVADGKITVYGKYIKELYEAENGVNYTFDNKVNGYFVSGVNEKINAYYGNASVWLEIADEINGYPVKYIGSGAFANEYDDTAHSLVNVLVPETVVAVYDRAFLDNKGLRSVAFCADKVFFGGRADADGTTSVFYGCYTDVSGNVNKAFTVYYNGTQNNPFTHVLTTNNTIDGAWNRIYFNKPVIGSATTYTMLTKSGGWSYVKFETEIIGLDGSAGVLPAEADLSAIIFDGIHFTAFTDAGSLANELDELLVLQLGKNVYDVTVSGALPVDGKRHVICVTVTEHEEIIASAADVEVFVKFGNTLDFTHTVTGVEPDAALADIYSALAFVGKESYAFIGWYRDEALTLLAPNKNDGTVKKLYAKVVLNSFTAANGAVYTFVPVNGNVPAHYAVSGFGAGADGVDYTQNDAWLVLENEVCGFPVTEIAAEAFAQKNIKNIVVPSNVRTVGTRAFLDNYGMLNAVFLADSVTMSGSVGNKNFPFYGCSSANGTNKTYLNVYYNSVVPSTQWNHFRDGNNYVGVGSAGGSVNGADSWGYVKFSVSGYDFAASDFGYADGLVTSPVNDGYVSAVQTAVISALNANSAYDGVIYNYSVLVTDSMENGIHVIAVEISDNSVNAWHKLALDGSEIQIENTAEIETVNGEYFVRQGATVTVRPVSGNEGLIRLTVYADADKAVTLYDSGVQTVCAGLAFSMPSQFAFVFAERSHLPITEVTLKSAVNVDGFTYNDGTYESTLTVNEGEALDFAPSAEGYTFLGWAYENSSHLLEFEATVQHRAYYAIWAHDRSEVVSVAFANGEFTAEIDTAKAVSVYGWYAYKSVNDVEIFDVPVTPSTLTNSTTVVYPRMVFAVSYSLSSGLSGTNKFCVNAENVENESSPNGSFNVLEGTQLKYRWAATSTSEMDVNMVLEVAYTDATAAEKTLFFRIKNKAWFLAQEKTVEVTISGAFTNSDVPVIINEFGSQSVDGNKAFEMRA